MKTKLLFFASFLAFCFLWLGCNSKNQYRPDTKIVSAFNQKYPNAKNIEWDTENGYQVADFRDNNMKQEAWFDNNGKWVMTKTDLRYNDLPSGIRNQFEKSMHNSWKKEDIIKLERTGMTTVYVVEVEKEGLETDLYYTENGNLIKTVGDLKKGQQTNYLPIAPTLKNKILQKYPNATILDTDDEKGRLHVDILDNGKSKEVVFDRDNWISTSWKINKADLPSTVMNALRNSEYNNHKIDDVYFYETPDSSYYRLELEHNDRDVYVDIDNTGQFLQK